MLNTKNNILKILKPILFIFLAISISPAYAGFSVSGTQLLDANGTPFVMRGINHPHSWYKDKTNAIADIASIGANTVRIVLSNGGQWVRDDGASIEVLIAECKANKVICVLEVHDATGYPESSNAMPLSSATDYWISSDILSAITGEEDYIIINIANEPFGNNVPESDYVNQTIASMQILRNAGITHTLMVDAGNWGQDWQHYMRNNAQQIFSSDPQKNTVFDVHMYEVFANASTQRAYVEAFESANLALIIGEFGPVHNGNDIDEDSILALAAEKSIGYIGWSWSGNGACCLDLELVSDFSPSSPTAWGTRLISGQDGIADTSVLASIYSDDNGNGQCTWTDGTQWPICEVDNGGWGWENGASCLSESFCPVPDNNDEECTLNDGTEWPICEVDVGGWGWEDEASCISNSICPSSGNTNGNKKLNRLLKKQKREWTRFLENSIKKRDNLLKRQEREWSRALRKLNRKK